MTSFELCVETPDRLLTIIGGSIPDHQVPALLMRVARMQEVIGYLRVKLNGALAVRFEMKPVGNELTMRVLTREATP